MDLSMRIPSVKLDTARRFAIRAHKDQKYSTEFPYAFHLQQVENILMTFGIYDEDMRIAAWLHDTLEDTEVTYEEIETYFGSNVTALVSAVTEPKGGNRAWRHQQTYPRIASIPQAITLKLADRLANVEASGKLEMYRKEHVEFKKALFDPACDHPTLLMWQYLDSLVV